MKKFFENKKRTWGVEAGKLTNPEPRVLLRGGLLKDPKGDAAKILAALFGMTELRNTSGIKVFGIEKRDELNELAEKYLKDHCLPEKRRANAFNAIRKTKYDALSDDDKKTYEDRAAEINEKNDTELNRDACTDETTQ